MLLEVDSVVDISLVPVIVHECMSTTYRHEIPHLNLYLGHLLHSIFFCRYILCQICSHGLQILY